MVDHSAVHALLVEAARQRRTVTYDDLVAAHPEAADGLAATLRAVSVESDDQGSGLLTALVVRRDTGLPGNGFFTLAAERGRDVSDRRAAWEHEVAAVYAAHHNRGSPGRG